MCVYVTVYNKSVCRCRTFIIVVRLFWKPSARGHLETVWAGPIILYYIIDNDDYGTVDIYNYGYRYRIVSRE